MDKLTIRKEIGALINSIKEHYDNAGDSTHISQLELELILHKIEKLYQKAIIYNHLNTYPVNIVSGEIAEKKEEEIIEKPVPETPKELNIPIPEPVAEKKILPVNASALENAEEQRPQEEKKAEISSNIKIQKALPDLTKSIGINDKFLFSNQLFAGNMQEFNSAVQQINGAENFEEARAIFEILRNKHNWDMEKEVVKQFVALVERRYS